MSQSISSVHDNLISSYQKSELSYLINNERQLFLKNKLDYIMPCFFLIKVISSL